MLTKLGGGGGNRIDPKTEKLCGLTLQTITLVFYLYFSSSFERHKCLWIVVDHTSKRDWSPWTKNDSACLSGQLLNAFESLVAQFEAHHRQKGFVQIR